MNVSIQASLELSAIIAIMETFKDIPEETLIRVLQAVEKINLVVVGENSTCSAQDVLEHLFEKYGV